MSSIIPPDRSSVTSPVVVVVHHSPTARLQAMVEAAVAGAGRPELDEVDVTIMDALAPDLERVLTADGFVLVTPTNFGYMSGALKHFFDSVYEPCLDHTVGTPFGLLVHGRTDATGAVDAVTRITTGLRWRPVAEPVISLGEVDQDDLDHCRELGATVAANLLL